MPSSPSVPVDDPTARLRALSNSPFDPEPPRRSRLVDAAMLLSQRTGRTGLATPHMHGGSAEEKVLYEYEGTADFWNAFSGVVGPADLAGKDVVDIGCGWGGKAICYAEQTGLRSIEGFDLPEFFDPAVPQAVAAERGLTNCRFGVGTAEDIPFPDESFDVAIIDDVLEHVRSPARAMAECHRVLRPGGLAIVKFPSFKMMGAHHLDRALTWPGLHFFVPVRVWAAGLNDYLLRSEGRAHFEPFDEIAATDYHPAITRNLNGVDFSSFEQIVRSTGFTPLILEPVPARIRREGLIRRLLAPAYAAAIRLPGLRERLAVTIAFAGRR